MPQTQKIQLAPITAWTLVKWFLIPGLILAYITLYPPHAISRFPSRSITGRSSR